MDTKKIAVITPVSHLDGVVELLESKGKNTEKIELILEKKQEVIRKNTEQVIYYNQGDNNYDEKI